MRHRYELSNESRKVLTSHVGRVAEEMEVADKYLYAILAGDKTDPFAMFAHLYAAAVRAGAPVCHFDHKLEAIRARYEKSVPLKNVIQCLTEKICADADTNIQMIEALKDGQIDAREAENLQQAVDKERSTLELLEVHLQFKRDLKSVGSR